MTKVLAESKQEFHDELDKELARRVKSKQLDALKQFAIAYFADLSIRDLQQEQWEELCGSVVSCWRFFAGAPGPSHEIRVINPSYEEEGWQSRHTIIEVVGPDYPFMVHSIRMAIIRREITIHAINSTVIGVERSRGEIVIDPALPDKEAVIHLEIDRQSSSGVRRALQRELLDLMQLVITAVDDFAPMRECVHKAIDQVREGPLPDGADAAQACELLEWLENDSFTFLGYEEFASGPRSKSYRRVPDSALGICKPNGVKLPGEPTPHDGLISFAKSPVRSPIHRPAYLDIVDVNRYDDKGRVTGIQRFLGLYTARVYSQSPLEIPIVGQKVRTILDRSQLDVRNYQLTALTRLIEVLPREELFLSETEELFETAMDILSIQERRMVRIFIRCDRDGNFVTCLMYLPRDVYTTQLRIEIQEYLVRQFDALEVKFDTQFSESILVRTYFEFRLDPAKSIKFDRDAIEEKILQLTRSWEDDLRDALLEAFGEEEGNQLSQRFRNAFPLGYKEYFSAQIAVSDIQHMSAIDAESGLAMSLYRSMDEQEGELSFKLFHADESLPLSDVIPILENLGTRVIEEYPYEVAPHDQGHIWIHDFRLAIPGSASVELQSVKAIFEQTFAHVWQGLAENDNFNKLVLGAGLNCREVSILRAYARYMRQIRFGFSQDYIADVLSRYSAIAEDLLQLFVHRFDPDMDRTEAHQEVTRLMQSVSAALEEVENLSDDRIIRRYVELILATLRTNYFQSDPSCDPKVYTSFKFDPQKIKDLPLPRPRYEIFVYSTRMEGVHLRGGKVARGGLRWSDRSEDYRTEILGLVKAQQVKNAVIVPVGAKGGFYPKNLPVGGSREEINEEGIACYRMFIRGLLDLTDNLRPGGVVAPMRVVHYDEDDPYLVVAADKGTATFSDIANELALSYGFWLGDAFASGGSAGYDHRAMGITAKGAWKSVQQHFRDAGIDVQNQDFTVIGIGDMAGDVFGNGMLMSRHIRLVAAFNHIHIFVDPDPDPEASYEERLRLYGMPRSSWLDYDRELISRGGGVFSRAAKTVPISTEMQQRFAIEESTLTPNELIVALLKAPVDLLWNGGIGTYVKAEDESHADVGDKANDAVRIDGAELGARVVGEGGNLGMTQLGRIEYAQRGGCCFTDFIDNAGGVNCSDIEVNIKILLNEVVRNGDMTVKQRNQMLEEMTEDVTQLVLHNNYHQAQAINLSDHEATRRLEEYSRLLRAMVAEGKLDRELEFLPDEEELIERKAKGTSLTSPEISVLTSYAKMILKESLLASDVVLDEYLGKEIERAFPPLLVGRFPGELKAHRLYREIVTTQLVNGMVNRMGMTFVHRLNGTTGAPYSEIAKAYVCARDVYRMDQLWSEIEALDYHIDPDLQRKIMAILIRLVRKATRWFIRNRRTALVPMDEVRDFEAGVFSVCDDLENLLAGDSLMQWQSDFDDFIAAGVSESLARVLAGAPVLISALGIVEVARQAELEVGEVASIHFTLGEELSLLWFGQQIYETEVSSHWHARAREAFHDELDWQHRALTDRYIQWSAQHGDAKLDQWIEAHSVAIDKWQRVLADMRMTDAKDYAVYSVAVRELLHLAQNSVADVEL